MEDIVKSLEERYEREIGEPWSALEERVRGRHVELFKILDQPRERERDKLAKQWWRFW